MEKFLLPRCYVCSGFPHRTGLEWVFAKRFTQDTIALGPRLGHQKTLRPQPGTTTTFFPFSFFQAALVPTQITFQLEYYGTSVTRLQLGRIKNYPLLRRQLLRKGHLKVRQTLQASPLLKPKRRALGMNRKPQNPRDQAHSSLSNLYLCGKAFV